jgi:hypothetical protein
MYREKLIRTDVTFTGTDTVKGTTMTSRLIVDLPDDLKKRLKAYCANNGTTIHDEILSMICQNLEAYAEATKDENPQGQPQTPEAPIQTGSRQQIKEADIEITLRKALGLKEKGKREVSLSEAANDPLNIGLF